MTTTAPCTWKQIARRRQLRVEELLLENEKLRNQIAQFQDAEYENDNTQSYIEKLKSRIELGRKGKFKLKQSVKALEKELTEKNSIIDEYKRELIGLKTAYTRLFTTWESLKEDENNFRHDVDAVFHDWQRMKCSDYKIVGMLQYHIWML